MNSIYLLNTWCEYWTTLFRIGSYEISFELFDFHYLHYILHFNLYRNLNQSLNLCIFFYISILYKNSKCPHMRPKRLPFIFTSFLRFFITTVTSRAVCSDCKHGANDGARRSSRSRSRVRERQGKNKSTAPRHLSLLASHGYDVNRVCKCPGLQSEHTVPQRIRMYYKHRLGLEKNLGRLLKKEKTTYRKERYNYVTHSGILRNAWRHLKI